MRKLLISLLALFALAACASGGSDTATQEAAQTPATTETTETATPPAETTTTEIAAASVQTGEIEIVGTVGCGHCTHSIGEGCSAAVQTADGAIYILEDMDEGDEPFEQRFDGKSITVRGASVERDGIGYITVAAFEL
jgi:hypothetical protein